MRNGTKRLALSALAAAVSVCLLFLAAFVPSGRIGLVAIAGIMPAVAVINYGVGAGFACFVVSAALALLISPLKSAAILYCLFFGHWPMVKSFIERIPGKALEWTVKLIWFNLILTLTVVFMKNVVFQVLPHWSLIPMYAAGNVAFVLYDCAFSVLIVRIGDRMSKLR